MADAVDSIAAMPIMVYPAAPSAGRAALASASSRAWTRLSPPAAIPPARPRRARTARGFADECAPRLSSRWIGVADVEWMQRDYLGRDQSGASHR